MLTGIYSGLAPSLASGRWQPSGTPAVYRLLEALATRPGVEVTFVFLASEPDPRFPRSRRLAIAPLGVRVHIIARRSWGLLDRIGAGKWLSEFEQAARILWIAARLRPAVAYCTNAAFVAASMLAWLGIAPVVLRFLGIFPIHRQLARGGGSRLARWLYRAPFAKAVSTLDGSGAEVHLPRLLTARTPIAVLLNGVDTPAVDPKRVTALRADSALSGRLVIGFLGRLEPYKGCETFVEALLALERLRPGAFSALIVGEGPLKAALAGCLATAGLSQRVVFTGALPHTEVAAHLKAMDIYVSLNAYGNLSNANLEAIAAGRCMVILEGDAAQAIDQVTEALLPREIVPRVPRTDTGAALSTMLADLISDPAEIERRSRAITELAQRLLTSWQTRIEEEINLIRAAARHPYERTTAR